MVSECYSIKRGRRKERSLLSANIQIKLTIGIIFESVWGHSKDRHMCILSTYDIEK